MDREKIVKRISYQKMELAHHGFHDGWVLDGMRKELKELEEKLNEK